MNLSAGTLLRGGTYRIVRFIDSGGFGCTYEAEHLMLQKRVAIKEFFVKDYCNRDENTSYVVVGIKSKEPLVDKLKKKFLDEARAVSRFRHPGIVQVSDVFEENGTAYYVMDYIEGRSLKDMVKAEGPMPERRALKYVFQVAEALKYVHARNRLHLDVKPGNIMVDGSDNAILIDFGTSKQYDEESGENTSTLLGYTPGYAPPEQMSKSVVKFLPATDVYALGATLYKLLTGKTPLDANDRISGSGLVPLPAGISNSVCRAVSAAMSLDKRQRPQSVEEFMGLLPATTSSKGSLKENGKSFEADSEETHLDEDKDKHQDAQLEDVLVLSKKCKVRNKKKFKNVLWVLGVLLLFYSLLWWLMVPPSHYVSNGYYGFYNPSTGLNDIFGRWVMSDRRYTGEFKDGEFHGHGKLTLADESYFEGVFKEGVPYMGKWFNKDNSLKGITTEGFTSVDLGLSVQWAVSNLGASSVSDYGDYFAWGEISSKSEYTEENSLTLGKDIGDISGFLQYDAAAAIRLGGWRMPTVEEMTELVEKCEWELGQLDGKNGYIVTGVNGNSIFLPFAGWKRLSWLNTEGEGGLYWTSTPDPNDLDRSSHIHFENDCFPGIQKGNRYYGRSIRPVIDNPKTTDIRENRIWKVIDELDTLDGFNMTWVEKQAKIGRLKVKRSKFLGLFSL